MDYNYLKGAKSIRNPTLCVNDTLDAFVADFSVNGNVDGWDIYSDVYMYGCWDNVLFGTAYERSCFIQRSNNFLSVRAEDYYIIELVLKITPDTTSPHIPTKGKIMWLLTSDNIWSEDKSIYFELKSTDNWQRYRINLGPARWWQGYVNNLRIYPFVDGHRGCRFAFKVIKITSLRHYTCKETSCDYYTKYEHPCPGAGKRGSCVSANKNTKFTTISGLSSTLYVNIDNYGDYLIDLGTNINVNIDTICKKIEEKLSSLSIGSYEYSTVSSTEFNNIKITSGTVGEQSEVTVVSGTAAKELGFFDSEGIPIYTKYPGIKQASHFDYVSSVKLSFNDIQALLEDPKTVKYTHKPNEYDVEIGNKDFYYSISSNRTDKSTSHLFVRNFDNVGSTIIDVSHPASSNGKITDIYISCGKVSPNSKIYILRPKINGAFELVYTLDIPTEEEGVLYTTKQTTHHIKCDLHVIKGDVFGIYNAKVAVAFSQIRKLPDACFFKVDGELREGIIHIGEPRATGTVGFHIFGRSSRISDTLLLDVDFGYRVNLNYLYIHGREEGNKFEYNLVICKDVSWQVNCLNETHKHTLCPCLGGQCVTYVHKNIPYGVDCLSDGKRIIANGRQGTYFVNGPNGIETYGEHSYFYVNGDGEWDIGPLNDPKQPIYEFYNPPWCTHINTDYIYDPIHFTLTFPNKSYTKVHKTIMYFKEGKNFRHFSLEYFINDSLSQKKGVPVGYNYISKYNYIGLDSVIYTEENFYNSGVSENVRDYLFKNPTSWVEPIYSGDVCINWDIVQTARDLSWNVLEHGFDPIETAGFRIIVDHHVSTKMTELELYSAFPVEPSLVDNAYVLLSTDGKYWHEAVFDYTDNKETIKAPINMSPRYLRISLYSEDLFYLYGIRADVTDSLIKEDCGKDLLLTFRDSYVSDVYSVAFRNNYTSLSDFTVALPKEASSKNTMVADVNLANKSDNDVVIVYKNEDHLIELKHRQIANNTLFYGLKNLADGKSAFLLDNTVNSWKPFGSPQHNVSFNQVFYNRGNVTYVLFSVITCRYLVLFLNVGYGTVTNIGCYLKNNPVPISKVFISGRVKNTPLGLQLAYNGMVGALADNNDLSKALVFEDGFQDFFDYNVWGIIRTENVFSNNISMRPEATQIPDYNGYILYPTSLLKDTFVGITTTFDRISDFYFITHVNFKCDGFYPLRLSYKFMLSGNVVFYYVLEKPTATERTFTLYDTNYVQVANTYLGNGDSPLKIELTLQNEILTINIHDLDGASLLTTNISNFEAASIDGIECVFTSEQETVVIVDYISFGIFNLRIFAINAISNTLPLVLDFGENVEIDRLSLFSQQDMAALSLGYMYSLGSVFTPITIESLTTENFDYNFTIDLGKKHVVDIIRNYGNMQNKLPVSKDSAFVRYSFSDTSDPSEVDWGVNFGTCLLKFDEPDGATNFTDSLTDRPIHNNGVISSSTQSAVGGTSGYFSGEVFLTIEQPDLAFDFKANDFGVFLYLYLGSNVYDTHSIFGLWETDKVFKLELLGDRRLCFTINTSNNIEYSFVTKQQVPVGTYFSFEVSRSYWLLYIFVDGALDSVHDIGIIQLQHSVLPMYLGAFPQQTYNGFYGYMDFLYIRTGHFIHTSAYGVGSFLNDFKYTDKKEYRWINFIIPSTNDYAIDKVGIYPDITVNYLLDGYTNCEWQPLGNVLANYVASGYNIANQYFRLNASSQVYNSTPEKAFNGITEVHSFDDCWGFSAEDSNPKITLMLDYAYKIDKVVIYHGAEEGLGYGTVDFKIMGYATTSGTDPIILAEAVNNTEYITTHTFEPVTIQKFELDITNYVSGNAVVPTTTDDGLKTTTTLSGGFIREIEIYTTTQDYILSSEEYPIVCCALNYPFKISDFKFIYTDNPYQLHKTWLKYADNKADFMYVSDSVSMEPNRIAFKEMRPTSIYFQYTGTINYTLFVEEDYVIGSNVFFDKGTYKVTYSVFDNTGDNSIGLKIVGPTGTQLLYPETLGPDVWTNQTNQLLIDVEGIYDIFAFLENTANFNGDKSLQNVTIFRSMDYVRWLVTKDDTATDYSFDGITTNYGPHYMREWKIYGGEHCYPTEYSKWWLSHLSTLNDNYVFAKEGKSILQINYPTGSGIDYVMLREGDTFVEDLYWLEKDFLSFYLYIDDVDNLDTTYGSFGFGSPNGYDPNLTINHRGTYRYAYGWDIADIDLHSGWNKVKLKFYDGYVMPETTSYDKSKRHPVTNIRNKIMCGFIMYYRGNGNGPLTMYLDRLRIQRSYAEEEVFGQKALCLSFNEFAELNLSNLTISKGTISLYMKMYNDSRGLDLYDELNSRTIFSLTSSANDIITLGIQQGSWFEFGVGNAWRKYIRFSLQDNEIAPTETFIAYDEAFHICVMWDNSGGMSNGDSFRLYLDGELVWYSKETWDIESHRIKHLVLGGGAPTIAFKNLAEGSAVFSRLRAYNYCLEYSDYREKFTTNEKAEDYVSISIDGINFYNSDFYGMPLTVSGVAPGDEVKVYIKATKDANFKTLKEKTASLLVDWVVAV